MITELNKKDSFNKYRYLLVDNFVALNSISPLSRNSLISLFGKDNVFGEKKLTPVLRSDLDYDPSICPTLVKLADPIEFLESSIMMKSANKLKSNVFGQNVTFVLILSVTLNHQYWQINLSVLVIILPILYTNLTTRFLNLFGCNFCKKLVQTKIKHG